MSNYHQMWTFHLYWLKCAFYQTLVSKVYITLNKEETNKLSIIGRKEEFISINRSRLVVIRNFTFSPLTFRVTRADEVTINVAKRSRHPLTSSISDILLSPPTEYRLPTFFSPHFLPTLPTFFQTFPQNPHFPIPPTPIPQTPKVV